MVDIISLISSFATIYGIYAILAISLNLEYGYAGQPNFGQVLFYGLGSFVGAIAAANLLPIFAGLAVGNICDAHSFTVRYSIGSTDPGITISVWLIALILAMIAGGIFGLLVSYPALRVKEEWYLSMILLVAGEAFVIVVENTQQIGCGFNGVDGIQNPFYWIFQSYSTSSLVRSFGVDLVGVIYAAVILGFAAICFIIAQRLANSPYGRLLKSIRDDSLAAESLGKDVAKVRKQIMIIGSVMAGLAGGLFVFYIGAASTENFAATVTFAIWVMMILGGNANNRGVLVGVFAMTLLSQGSVLVSVLLQSLLPNFDTSILIYLEYAVQALILLLLLIFRPRGLIPETKIMTKAYQLFDFSNKKQEIETKPNSSGNSPSQTSEEAKGQV
jgi:branched-chain amino acid transport system permease protein